MDEIRFDKDGICLVQGDCIEEMKKIQSESIDCIIVDPPYNISQEGKVIYRDIKKYRWKRRTNIGLDFGKWDRQWKDNKEFFDWTALWFAECCRVMKEGAWIYIFFDKQKTGFFDLILAPKFGIKARCIYVWVKTNPIPSFRKVNWNSGTEHIWVGSKGESRLKNFKHQKYMNNYFLSPNSSAYKETEHPTEKPKKLISHLIEVNSNPNDLILDFMMGSGTTGIMAKELGRRFIGIEIDPKYFSIAQRRINQAVRDLI